MELEAQRVPAEWNETRTDYPREKPIHRLFEEQAKRTPDAIAVVSGGRKVSYRELNEQANCLARQLMDLGPVEGRLVALCMQRSVEMIAGLLGILKAGAAYLPLDSDYPEERLRYMLRDGAAATLLVHEPTRNRMAWCAGDVQLLCMEQNASQAASARTENLGLDVASDALAYVMYTSGSTGLPKGVMVPHRGVVRLVKNTRYCCFGPEEVFLQLAPVSFDASTFEIWGALLNGGRLVLMPPATPSLEDIGDAIRRHGVTTLWLTAGLFHLMVEQRPQDLSPLRQLLAGGDVLLPGHVRLALAQMKGGRLINGYGPTECTTFTCCHSMTAANPPEDIVPIGRPISNTTVYVLDNDLQPVAIGDSGELYVGGDGLAHGYWNDPALTASKFIQNPFSGDPGDRLYRTGDLVRYQSDGTLLFLGRVDNQVKLAGHRIEPGEIEAALCRHPCVRQAVVVARTDRGDEKKLVAYVLVPNAPAGVSKELHKYLSETLPRYMVPATILVVDRFPLNFNGKVDRAALPGPESLAARQDQQYQTQKADSIDLQISQVWEKVLKIPNIGLNDNFFDLGGDSLQLIEAHAELQKLFREIC